MNLHLFLFSSMVRMLDGYSEDKNTRNSEVLISVTETYYYFWLSHHCKVWAPVCLICRHAQILTEC